MRGSLVSVVVLACLPACFVFGSASLFAEQAVEWVQDQNGQNYRLIQAGHFTMGASPPGDFYKDHLNRPTEDDRPVFPVILTEPFYVATTEVTVGQFANFIRATGYVTTAERLENSSSVLPPGILGWQPCSDDRGRHLTSFVQQESFTWQDPGFAQTDQHPVVGVSFADAVAYCEWLSERDGERYRLPTEAQWEYVCRAGSTTHFSFGDSYRGVFHRYANMADADLEQAAPERGVTQWLFDVDGDQADGYAFTAPVGSYQPNPWGLHDLHGNVWEWCQDQYLDTRYKQFQRPKHGAVQPRAVDPLCTQWWNQHGRWQVIRGGSWYLAPLQCRSSSRGMLNAEDATCYVGFRVVRDADAELRKRARQQHERSETALGSLIKSAKQTHEYDEHVIQFEWTADSVTTRVLDDLAALQYEVDVTIRPPGKVTHDTIARLADVSRLRGFVLATKCLDGNEQTFAMLSEHPQLKRLQITGSSKLADEDLFPYLRSATELQEIALQGDGITDEGLASLLPLPQLRSLRVESTSVTGTCFASMTESPLRQLSIGQLTDSAATELVPFADLDSLDCSDAKLGKDAIIAISQLRKLKTLNISGCDRLSDQDLARLSELSQLSRLSIERTRAGESTCAQLPRILTLRELTIGGENLTDRAMHAISQIVSLRELTITAEATALTNVAFRDCWRLVNLRGLTIEAPQISAEAVVALSELKGLQRLRFKGTRVKADSLKKLQARCPNTKIEVRP